MNNEEILLNSIIDRNLKKIGMFFTIENLDNLSDIRYQRKVSIEDIDEDKKEMVLLSSINDWEGEICQLLWSRHYDYKLNMLNFSNIKFYYLTESGLVRGLNFYNNKISSFLLDKNY